MTYASLNISRDKLVIFIVKTSTYQLYIMINNSLIYTCIIFFCKLNVIVERFFMIREREAPQKNCKRANLCYLGLPFVIHMSLFWWSIGIFCAVK